jgi:hypothetical protein
VMGVLISLTVIESIKIVRVLESHDYKAVEDLAINIARYNVRLRSGLGSSNIACASCSVCCR